MAAHPVRFALPFPVCCLRCNKYMDKFTRHNAQKEVLPGVTSCGSEVYRFAVKCAGCGSTYTLLSDPEGGCYKAESSCFKVPEKIGEEHSDDKSPTSPGIDCRKRYAELLTLKRRYERLMSTDIDLAIQAVCQGKTVQELSRERILETLKKVNPVRKHDFTSE